MNVEHRREVAGNVRNGVRYWVFWTWELLCDLLDGPLARGFEHIEEDYGVLVSLAEFAGDKKPA